MRSKPSLGGEDRLEAALDQLSAADPQAWELRLGNLRVYFDAVREPEPVVVVLAIGIKDRNAVRIGKTVINL